MAKNDKKRAPAAIEIDIDPWDVPAPVGLGPTAAEPTTPGGIRTFGEQATNILGYGPHAYAAYKSAAGDERPYSDIRDLAIQRFEERAKQSPTAAMAGKIGRTGIEAAGLLAATPATVPGAVVSGGLIGALQNPGDVPGEVSLQPEARLRGAAIGAGTGYIGARFVPPTMQMTEGTFQNIARNQSIKALQATPAQRRAIYAGGRAGELGDFLIENRVPGDVWPRSYEGMADVLEATRGRIGQSIGRPVEKVASIREPSTGMEFAIEPAVSTQAQLEFGGTKGVLGGRPVVTPNPIDRTQREMTMTSYSPEVLGQKQLSLDIPLSTEQRPVSASFGARGRAEPGLLSEEQLSSIQRKPVSPLDASIQYTPDIPERVGTKTTYQQQQNLGLKQKVSPREVERTRIVESQPGLPLGLRSPKSYSGSASDLAKKVLADSKMVGPLAVGDAEFEAKAAKEVKRWQDKLISESGGDRISLSALRKVKKDVGDAARAARKRLAQDPANKPTPTEAANISAERAIVQRENEIMDRAVQDGDITRAEYDRFIKDKKEYGLAAMADDIAQKRFGTMEYAPGSYRDYLPMIVGGYAAGPAGAAAGYASKAIAGRANQLGSIAARGAGSAAAAIRKNAPFLAAYSGGLLGRGAAEAWPVSSKKKETVIDKEPWE